MPLPLQWLHHCVVRTHANPPKIDNDEDAQGH